MSPRLALLAPALLLVAGCVTPPASDAPAADADASGWTLPFPDPMGQDHDHGDASLHANAWNFEMTDHHPLAGGPTRSSGAHALDVKNGWLFAAVYGGEADREGGFFVFDVSDPAHPKETGRFRYAGPLGGDRSLEATPDADFVVLGTEAVDCIGHVNPFGPGIYLVDVRDKANPQVAHYLPATGVHTVTVARIGEEDYVFAVTANENVFRIVREPVPMLERVATLPIGHDAVVLDDPLAGKPLLFAANGQGGMAVWDVSDPAAPQEVAGWNIPDRGDKYYVHTTAVRHVDGKRVVVVSSEDWGDYPSALWVLDATDLQSMQVLAEWSAPGGHAAEGLRYSMHNPRFLGDVLAVAHYHGGVWALDLSAPERPEVVGQYMPSESNGWTPEPTRTSFASDHLCGKFNTSDAPYTFDVLGGDGVLYVADLHTGLYTLRPAW